MLKVEKLKELLVNTNISQYAIGTLFAQVFIMLAGNVSDTIFLLFDKKQENTNEPLSLKLLRTLVMSVSALIVILITISIQPPNLKKID